MRFYFLLISTEKQKHKIEEMAQAEKRKNNNNPNHDKQKSFSRYKGAIPPKSNITSNIKTVTYKVGYR